MKALLASFLALSTLASAAIEITVTPGTSSDHPLTAARDEVRARRQAGENGPATILVPDGRYEVQAPLALTAADSGLTIRAAQSASPLFLGGTLVSGFAAHQGEIVKATIPKQSGAPRQLFFAGKRMTLARYPNAAPKDPLYGGWAFVGDFPEKQPPTDHDFKSACYLRPSDLRTWAHPEDVEIDIFAQYGWWNFVIPVKSLDPATRLLTLAKPCGYPIFSHNRFYFQNALEELDAPGEWFLDPRTSTLYFWPPQPLGTQEVRLITLDSFIQIKEGAKEIRIEGLGFTGCNGTAVSVSSAEDCLIAGCSFVRTGSFQGSAISIAGGHRNTARSNDISESGSTGISLTGGDRITLTPADHQAINNHIWDFGVFNKNACGVGVTGAGHLVSHNQIHHGPRMGVQLSGNTIIVEYNHLHHLCLETQDGGAIYTGGRDWLGGRGDVWRYNHIHDIIGCGQEADGLKHPWFTFGLYPDDNTGGVDIIGNLVYRVAQSPIHMHNSRDCLVENNIFAFGGFYQFDLHGWRKDHGPYQSHLPSMVAGYESVSGQPAWKDMRGMALHPKDAMREDGTMMSGNVIQRNIMFPGTNEAKYGDLRHVTSHWNTIDQNLTWNGGQPIRTGIIRTGKVIGEPVFVEDFSATPPGKVPTGWGFNHRPAPTVQMAVTDGVLQADSLRSADPRNTHTVFHGPNLPLRPGSAYRIKLRAKTTASSSPIALSLAAYADKQGYWQSRTADLTLTGEWEELDIAAALPSPSSRDWKPWMTSFWLRVDCNGPEGQVLIDDIRISEAEALDEWQSWQQDGWDRNGIVADPLFEDAASDDFRLKPESPALSRLGFKALPIAEMGLIKDQWRTALP
jgi:hypothetical protein